MKKLLLLAGLLVALVGFSACESDETIVDRVVGRVWIGDLGFTFDNQPLESGIYLGSDGFGEDELCFAFGGPLFKKLKLKWFVEGETLYLDYGREAPPRELRHVYVGNGAMTGNLYIDGFNYNTVTLHMQ